MKKWHITASLTGLLLIGTSVFAAMAHAEGQPAFDIQPEAKTAVSAAPGPVAEAALERFPLTPTQLRFEGENRRLDFPFFVTAAQAAAKARLVLSLESAISVLPETSHLTVSVNDTVVVDSRLGLAGAQKLLADMPSGLLQPGFNAVRILVEQHHRVDCSIAGTYELWTALAPLASGFSFDGVTEKLDSLADLPGVRPDQNGRIAIRGIVRRSGGANVLDQTMDAIQSATLLGFFEAPVVDFSDQPGTGPGLDVIAGTLAELGLPANVTAGNTSIPFVSLLPAEGRGRPRLIVSGATADDLRNNLAQLARLARDAKPLGISAGLRAKQIYDGRRLSSRDSISFAELGADSRPFSGRHYRDEFRFSLPADFYAADYDQAAIVLEAGFIGGLSQAAQLVIRANDKVVTTLSLSAPNASRIDRQRMRIPLRSLKPGVNVINFEALLPSPADSACDVSVQLNPPVRFQVADTSTFSLPTLARVGHSPDIAAMAAGIEPSNGSGGGKQMTLLVPGLDPVLLGAAATFVAKIAATSGVAAATTTVATMPAAIAGDLVAFGGMSSLPGDVLGSVRLTESVMPKGAFASTVAQLETSFLGTSAFAASSPENDPLAAFAAPGPLRHETGMLAAVVAGLKTLADGADQTVLSLRSVVSGSSAEPAFTAAPDSGLIIAQTASPQSPTASWTVFADRSSDDLASAVTLATERDRWPTLGGAVTTVAGASGDVTVHPAQTEVIYQTQPLSFANARLVLAGWFSRHTTQYLVAFIATMLLLGVTSFAYVRRIGEKDA